MSEPETTGPVCQTCTSRGCPTPANCIEIANLRALVTRLTNVAQDLAGCTTDPGTEALAAIHCGRNFIYG